MKKYIALFTAAVIAASLTGCSSDKTTGAEDKPAELGNAADIGAADNILLGGNDEGSDDNVQIPNPLVEYETLADAEAAAGFDFAVPDEIDGNSPKSYIVIDGSGIIEVTYGDNAVSLRKAEGSEDISGDFNTYSDIINAGVGEVSITMREKDGNVFSAIWTDGGFTYSLYAADGISENTATTAISAAK